MSWRLCDLRDEAHSLNVNAWNWHPARELIGSFGIIDDGRLEATGWNGRVVITAEEAHLIGQRLRNEVIPQMKVDERVRLDGSITNEPQPVDLRADTNDLYGASYEWLAKVAAFCLDSDGFEVH